ncbi:MAG: hypothetical protein HY812_09225 [Planctomycetes bacterium]|nr:hypothetical protein [Planctomycetota bacterium]
MACHHDRTSSFSFKDLVNTLVTSANGASQRERLGRLLARLDSVAVNGIVSPDDRVQARTLLSEAMLVALGPDAAYKTLARALDDSDAIPDTNGKASVLAEAAASIGSLGSLGVDLLSRIEGHAAALEPSADRSRLFATLAVAYARAKDEQRAVKMTVRAMNSAEKIACDEERVLAFAKIAAVLHPARMADETAAALERARAVAARIVDPAARSRALLQVATALGRTGRADESLEVLAQALEEDASPAQTPVSATEAPASSVVIDDVPPVSSQAAAPEAHGNPAAPAGYVVGEDGVLYKDPTAGHKFPSFTGSRHRHR